MAAPATLAAIDRRDQGFLGDELATRDVEDAHAILHLGELGGVQEVVVLGCQWQVECEEIALPQELIQRHQRHTDGLEALRHDERVVTDYAHIEGTGASGHLGADAPEAGHTERLAAQLDADELRALPLAGVDAKRARTGCAAPEQASCPACAPPSAIVIAAGRVDDNDAALGGGVNVDVVDADPGAADDDEVLGSLREPRR